MNQRPPSRADLIASFVVASLPGNERVALERVAEAVAACGLDAPQTGRLKTAVAEATMNAIEHGNRERADVSVEVEVFRCGEELVVSITDQGGGARGVAEVPEPDLDLKLIGQQTARGWGLFLIRNMVDSLWVTDRGPRHTVWLGMEISPAVGGGGS
ncbi:MAG: ATP-binding protein [Candidatus Dormibacteria bacterium]